MRNRIAIIVIALLVLAGLAYAYFALMRSPETSTSSEADYVAPLPTIEDRKPEGIDIPTTPEVQIQGRTGIMTVPNFYTGAHQILSGTVIVTSTLEYEISYGRRNHLFTLLLLPDSTTAYRDYREQAEAELLRMLRITPEQACNLNAFVTIPDDYQALFSIVAPSSARLTFCP